MLINGLYYIGEYINGVYNNECLQAVVRGCKFM